MKFTKAEDGITEIDIHQSWLKTYLMCPERARRTMQEGDDWETDAANIGTACHAGIEHVIEYKRDEDYQLSVEDAIAASLRAWDEIEPGITHWIQNTPQGARNLVAMCTAGWYHDILPRLIIDQSSRVEQRFRVLLSEGFTERIYLAGTLDYIDSRGIWDWKTANRDYKQWEYQRWGVQPTAYAHGAVKSGWLTYPVRFNFAVMKKLKTKFGAEVVATQRHGTEVNWLREMVHRALRSSGSEAWDMRDEGWWCSAKWCPFWDTCKGKHVPESHFLWKP